MNYKNVINDAGDEINFDDTSCEFFSEVYKHLAENLLCFDDHLFIHYGHNGTRKPVSRLYKHSYKVLIVEGGENKMMDFNEIADDYYAIFAHYTAPVKKVVDTIPLGTFREACIPQTLLSERMYDIAFCGCLNNNRVSLASEITGIKTKWITAGLLHAKKHTLNFLSYYAKTKHPGHFYHFNPDFNKGVNKSYYNYLISQSKICLCPKGWVNAETFRLYEAMKSGCVVICNKLPDRWYYKNIPAIQVEDWREGYQIAQNLLKNPDELQKLSNASLNYYNKRLSGTATAKYIIKKLK